MPLPSFNDQAYLLGQQYRDGSNLEARIALHQRFSVTPYPWHRWVFDHVALPNTARVLEVGTGLGRLWTENADRIPPGWDVTVSDLSAGMLDEARGKLAGLHPFTFQVIDAQAIPYPNGTFDAALANHMPYHVPDRPRALAEFRRVLKPGGALYASTVGAGHMGQLNELVRRWAPDLPERGLPFTLENGRAQLEAIFPHVTRYDFADELVVTEAEPLIAYIRSMSAGGVFVGDTPRELTEAVAGELAAHGAFRITKSTGLFVARIQG